MAKTNQLDQVKVAQIQRDAAIALIKTGAERDALLVANQKLAADNQLLRGRMVAEKVAMDMHDKGIHTDIKYADLVDQLEKRAHADPQGFATLREAVNLTGPDMLKTASVASEVHAPNGSDFERYILGDIG